MDHGDGRCEKACIKPGKVNIREIVGKLEGEVRPRAEIAMPDDYSRLECDICGIPIENPFLLSSSVVASTYDMCARAFEWLYLNVRSFTPYNILDALC